jgi:hypothetical protein
MVIPWDDQYSNLAVIAAIFGRNDRFDLGLGLPRCGRLAGR